MSGSSLTISEWNSWFRITVHQWLCFQLDPRSLAFFLVKVCNWKNEGNAGRSALAWSVRARSPWLGSFIQYVFFVHKKRTFLTTRISKLWRGLWKHCQSLLNASSPDLVVFVHCLCSFLFCVYSAHQSRTLFEVSIVFLYNFNLNKLQLLKGGYKNLSGSSWN